MSLSTLRFEFIKGGGGLGGHGGGGKRHVQAYLEECKEVIIDCVDGYSQVGVGGFNCVDSLLQVGGFNCK